MKKLLVVLATLLFSPLAYAAACISNGTGGGKWNTETTWTDVSCGVGSVPGAADTVTIVAGDVVEIDGNISVGNNAANNTTYNIDISGTLYWPYTPGANWTFTTTSSIRINAGGILQVGTVANPMSVTRLAYFLFSNAGTGIKYKIYVNGGKFYVYGNSSYASSNSVYRARIFSCIPSCAAGAGRTLMLDRAVNWTASASLTHDAIIIGVGGNETSENAVGDDAEIITTWGSPGSSSINGVTLTEDHKIGDIVVNVSSNVLFQSDSSTIHSFVETTATDDPYNLNYVRFDEFGDTASTSAAITFNAVNNVVGTIDHVSLTNCADGAAVTGFYLNSSGWTKFEGNVAHDVRASGYGFYITGNKYPTGVFNIEDCSYLEGSASNGKGIEFNASSLDILLNGFWVSNASTNISSVGGSYVNITNCLSHGAVIYGIFIQDSSMTYNKFKNAVISNNEIRNSSILVYLYQAMSGSFKNNNLDGAVSSCLQTNASAAMYIYGNTYDRCNTNGTLSRAGFEILASTYNYDVYAVNESFGATTANSRANINIDVPSYNNVIVGSNRYVCNNCLFAATANPVTCGSMPTDGIIIYCVTPVISTVYIPDGTFLTLHNKDQAAGSHVGWGPGGMVITRETVTVVDNTLNVKVIPGNATEYGYLPLGTVNVVQGQTLTVNVQLRKDEAQSSGSRPRLALEGSGFDRTTTYDEMSDAINTWETATVSGVAEYSGSVHVFLGVKNNLSGADNYTPEWPPTVEIYADGISITKTGP